MNFKRILFVAGDVNRLASVRIRCRAIAERLGSQTLYSPLLAEDIPRGYDLYVCVKPPMRDEEILRLCERERVVWDYIDRVPPPASFAASIVSTRTAAMNLGLTGAVLHIPHHHCNYERALPRAKPDAIAWIGHSQWYPGSLGLNELVHFVERYDRDRISACYLQSGLLLNTRRQSPDASSHIVFNSGVKLINAIGFGIPSVSSLEPAYVELDETNGCTILSKETAVLPNIRELLADPHRYRRMQERCLSLAEKYHIDTIIKKYRQALRSL